MQRKSSRKRPEAEFLDKYMGWLNQAGYDLVFHVIDSKQHAKVTASGFPDTIATHPKDGLLVAELKAAHGRCSPDQWNWLTRLAKHLPPPADPSLSKSRVHLWFPKDEDAIRTQLKLPYDDGSMAPPTPCACAVCRYMEPSGNATSTTKSKAQRKPTEIPCPLCRRSTDAATVRLQGICGRCLQAGITPDEAELLKGRIMESVF